MKKILVIFCFLSLFTINESNAQCAMCKATAESNMKDGRSTVGRGLNSGILFLMAIPYMMAATGLGIWYYNKKKRQKLVLAD
jgi:hypothetical protein